MNRWAALAKAYETEKRREATIDAISRMHSRKLWCTTHICNRRFEKREERRERVAEALCLGQVTGHWVLEYIGSASAAHASSSSSGPPISNENAGALSVALAAAQNTEDESQTETDCRGRGSCCAG